MDLEFFDKRIACAVNQAKVRNIRLSTDGWCTRHSHMLWELDPRQNRAFILAFFVEGKPYRKDQYEIDVAAKTLGVNKYDLQQFSNGYCCHPPTSGCTDIGRRLWQIGDKYRKITGV